MAASVSSVIFLDFYMVLIGKFVNIVVGPISLMEETEFARTEVTLDLNHHYNGWRLTFCNTAYIR